MLHHPDPFVAGAKAEVAITLERRTTPEGRRYSGHWEISGEAGALLLSEEVAASSSSVDCGEVVDGLAFKLAYWIDSQPVAAATAHGVDNAAPNEATAPAHEPPCSAEPECPPPKEAFVPPPLPAQGFLGFQAVPRVPASISIEPAVPPGRPGRFFVSAAGLVGLALMPHPAGGAAIGFGWRAPWWSVALEARVLVSLGSELVSGDKFGSFDFVRTTGALLPCLHFRWLMGCAVLDMGSLHVEATSGTKNQRSPVDSLALGIGGRVGLELPLGPVALRAGVDVLGAALVNGVRDDGVVVWRQPAAGALPWLGLAGMF